MKPTKHKKECYVYNECRDYLENKYKYDERDYAGHFKDRSQPYLDFWHWICDHYTIHNGCYITFYEETLSEITEDWVKNIYSYYLKEFGEDGELTIL